MLISTDKSRLPEYTVAPEYFRISHPEVWLQDSNQCPLRIPG